jgi:transglutaminase-like putative cysteine protease
VVWRLTQKTPPPLGFNVWLEAPQETPVGAATVEITAPQDLALHWAKRGGFDVSDITVAGQRHIAARVADTRAEESERAMVSPSDFQPLFLVTSLPDLQSLGRIFFEQSKGKATVTPEIAALAQRIAGARHGLDAARAVYDWVASNIRYVAVYLDANDGWVPHAASEVLSNGYGDCKDHVVLMQALLAALGIRAEPALVDWSDRTTDLPLWVPQFNHAIIYLPDFDRFANPTSPYARFDSLDRRMAGKTVVIATAEGRIGHTPPMRPEDNVYRMDGHVVLDADGSLSGTTKVVLAAGMEDSVRAAVAQSTSPEDLAERMLATTPEGGEGTFFASHPRDLTQPFAVEGTWHSPHGVLFEGANAYMTTPVGLDMQPPGRLRYYLLGDGPRRHGLLIPAGDSQWSTTVTLPAGVACARLPANVDRHNDAGSFEASYRCAGRELTVVRRLVIEHSVYSAASYPDLQALLYATIDDARSVLVLTKVEAEASAGP